MLTKVLHRIDAEMHRHATESAQKALPAENLAFEAGRRHGLYQGLNLARNLVIEVAKGDEDDSGSRKGAAERRFS